MKRHTNAIFKKIKKDIVHLANSDYSEDGGCECNLCKLEATSTYSDGYRHAMLLIESAILNDERMETLKNAN